MTKRIRRPFTDYPIVLATGLSLAGAVVAYRIHPDYIGTRATLGVWCLISLFTALHMFTKTSPHWNSAGLRHAPGRVVINLTMLAILPANAMAVLAVWAIATGWTTPMIAAVWMTSSLLINFYATIQLARYMKWI